MSRIQFTDEIRSRLQAERVRTGCGIKALFTRTKELPQDLTVAKVDNWLRGNSSTIRQDYFDFVIKAYENLPDNAKSLMSRRTERGRKKRDGYTPLNDNIRNELALLQETTKCYPTALLRRAPNCPDGLKPTTIKNWLSGKVKTAQTKQLDFVLSLWRNLAVVSENTQTERIELTPALQNEMRRLRSESGIGAMKLLKGCEDIPKGLNSAVIGNWLQGSVSSIKKSHLDYVVKLWSESQKSIPVTGEMTRHLNDEFKRTGISHVGLLRMLNLPNSKLSTHTFTTMRKGKRRAILETEWDAIVKLLATIPDNGTTIGQHASASNKSYLGGTGFNPKGDNSISGRYKSHLASDYIPVTDEIVTRIKAERERTGIGAKALLRQFEDEKPDKLSATTISAWINCTNKNASKLRLSWVLERWASLPDKSLK